MLEVLKIQHLKYIFDSSTTAKQMSLSACDIGNPAYESAGPQPETGEGIVKVEVWFSGGDRSKFYDIEYQHKAHPEGLEVWAAVPDFSEYILGPDDIQTDIIQAIEEELGRGVKYFNWLSE